MARRMEEKEMEEDKLNAAVENHDSGDLVRSSLFTFGHQDSVLLWFLGAKPSQRGRGKQEFRL